MGSVSGPISRIRLGGGEAAYDGNGGLTFTGTQPASVAVATGTAAPDWTWTGATGGNTTVVLGTGTGGTGTDYIVTTGAGGVASAAATVSVGGRGGNWTATLGNGGAANDAANLGTNQGGKGGTFTRTAGNGGAAANGTSNTPGAGGDIVETAGNAGTGGNANGGNYTVTAGRSTGSGTEGAFTVVTGGSTRLTVAGTGVTSIGANGTTNPALQVDPTAASAATGLKVTAAAAASGVALAAISSGTDEALSIASKGAAALTLLTNSLTRFTVASTGAVTIATPTSGTGLTVSGGGGSLTGQVLLPTQGSGGGLVIGTDTNLYRSATSTLKTDNKFLVGGYVILAIAENFSTLYSLKCLRSDDTASYPDIFGSTSMVLRAQASSGSYCLLGSASLTLSRGDGSGAALSIGASGAATLATAATAGGAVTFTITPGAHTALIAEVLDVSLGAHSVTLTDGTTIALARSAVFGATTYVGVAAGGAETVTTAITAEFGLPVQGANLTLTNAPISARFLGNVIVGNILPPAAGPTNTLAIASGTAPTAVVADSAAIFAKDADGAAGYACPHMIVETNATALIIAGVAITAGADTGNPYEGLFQIDKTANTLKAWADGAWRTIASGW